MESVTSMTSILSQAESMLSEDSVFDTSSVYNGDVEMSDASSVCYDDDDDDPAGDNESTFGGGGGGGADGDINHNNVYKNYLKVNGGGKRGGASVDQPCHSSDMDTDMDMDMDTPTVGGRPGYAVERLGLGIC